MDHISFKTQGNKTIMQANTPQGVAMLNAFRIIVENADPMDIISIGSLIKKKPDLIKKAVAYKALF